MKKLLTFFLVVLSAISFNRCKPYDTVIVTDVALNPMALTLAPGETATLTAIVIPGNATIKSVIWKSGNEAVATVDVTGKVTAVAKGMAIITATTMCEGKTASCVVMVASSAPAPETRTFTVGTVSFDMVPVEAGTFQMGNPGSTHQVTLTQKYYIGKFEVTQGLWEAVMGSWPEDEPSDSRGRGADYPAYNVSWDDICDPSTGFLKKLNDKTGMTFTLPTEAQWEFAAAGGKKGYANGTRKHKYSGSDAVGDVAWYSSNSNSKIHEVGRKAVNELGINDMSGNVFEWCADRYGEYGTGSVTDPTGPATGFNRVLRGGSWSNLADGCTVSSRLGSSPVNRSINYGFRLAWVP